jgi:hypothetical protein
MQSLELFCRTKMPPRYAESLKHFTMAGVRTKYMLVHIRCVSTHPPVMTMVEAMSVNSRSENLVKEIMRQVPLSLNHVTGRATGKLSARFALWRIVIITQNAVGVKLDRELLPAVLEYGAAKKRLMAVSSRIRKDRRLANRELINNGKGDLVKYADVKIAMMVIHRGRTDNYGGYPIGTDGTKGNYQRNHLSYMPLDVVNYKLS